MIIRIITAILAIVSLSFLLPLATALYYGEKDMIAPFALPKIGRASCRERV